MSTDFEIAQAFAREVRASGLPRTRRKVTTILSRYGSHRLTEGLRERIAAAFLQSGLVCEPSMLTVDRAASVRLSLAKDPADQRNHIDLDGGLPPGVKVWQRTELGWQTSSPRAGAEDVLLVDVNLSVISEPEMLREPLLRSLRGLDSEALQDLLERDDHTSFKRESPESAKRASLSVVVLDEGKIEGPDDAVMVSLGVIEFAVGRNWILIVRHLLQSYVNGSPADTNHVAPSSDDYFKSLEDYGLTNAVSPSTAALAVIDHAVDSFGRSRDELASYVESWRNDFNAGMRDRGVLGAVQASLPILVDALAPFKHPSVRTWVERGLQPPRAENLSDQVVRNLEALRGLSKTTGDAIAQADQAKTELHQAKQSAMAYADQVQNERYQASLATLAAVLLAPALVASIFGASDVLSDSPVDLIWLIAAMATVGWLTQQAISRKLHPRSRRVAKAALHAENGKSVLEHQEEAVSLPAMANNAVTTRAPISTGLSEGEKRATQVHQAVVVPTAASRRL